VKERVLAHPLVVHCKRSRYDTYIGRGSKWGNPFRIGAHGTREQVIDLYEQWLLDQPDLLAALGELTGLVLGCWCAPRRCHGELLAVRAARLITPSPGCASALVGPDDSLLVPPF
jgi:hypothetical protein